MLRFTSLMIEDIGPFKGQQTIDFTNENGVTFIWGNNGRGKTTLLNIFRYALFGRFQNRRGALVDYTTLSNLESRIDGVFGFKVVLRMLYDDVAYELTRQFKPRKGINHPSKNDDFEFYMFLKRNTSILSDEEAQHILKSIMPEQVSRFFLFDGELLQEYEELLLDDAEAGHKIKTSIEKILGVPVLTNGATDTDEVLSEYQRAKNKAAQNDQKTQQLASQIETLTAQLEAHITEFDRMQSELTAERAKKNQLEGELQESEHVNKLIENIHIVEAEIASKKVTCEQLLSAITTKTKDAWKGLVGARVAEILEGIQSRLSELESKKHDHELTQHFISEMERAIETKHCEICDQDVGDSYIEKLIQRINSAKSQYGGLEPEEMSELTELQSRRAVLNPMQHPSGKSDLESLEKLLSEAVVAVSDNERKLKALRDDLKKHGEEDELATRMQTRTRELSTCISKIENLEEGKAQQQEKINDTKSTRQSLNDKLDQLANGAEMKGAKRRVELCEQIHAIFEEGIDAYRDRLRADVERDATTLFCKISSDSDYERLAINENYGLSIVHKSGETVPLRSAGFEHVVALSLIGALHKNAPLRGPIIMDSPFGRLDSTHKARITNALPDMSEQIVLLAYTSEINEQQARKTLGVALKREYSLEKQSSFYTRIVTPNN